MTCSLLDSPNSPASPADRSSGHLGNLPLLTAIAEWTPSFLGRLTLNLHFYVIDVIICKVNYICVAHRVRPAIAALEIGAVQTYHSWYAFLVRPRTRLVQIAISAQHAIPTPKEAPSVVPTSPMAILASPATPY